MAKYLIYFSVLGLFISCASMHTPDISDSKLTVKIERLECDLFIENLDKLPDTISFINNKYPEFFNLFTSQIIRIGLPNSPGFDDNLRSFTTDFVVYQTYEKTMKVFPDVNKIEAGLTNAFRYYHHYFPMKEIPSIYTYISGFNESIIVGDSFLAIGLDKYLGRDCDFYKRLMLNEYQIQNMHADMIVPDCMKAWAVTEFPYNDSIHNLINQAIYNGKIHYFQQCMMPFYSDSLIMGFTSKQTEWCKKNEKQMWQYLVEQKLLFEKSLAIINNFTREGPFTKDFTRNSPARAVNWLGWMIVKSYMKKNTDISLLQLMQDDDYQKILQKAKYKP